ncbi:MAG: PHB depolymerase family esterase [Hoeflea sp.]|uniref:extracellular catalytic domain type 1 short-chain-length polyhydroxyalkanoate depolymerase n=1 Tax=Hoeflea sp. TaxID=1940281 RepID=UPI001DAC618D|nr:PHB depolymerase family esterase [Hoeflea sp.]MBU4527799.1 PHB depolymerase family esterase [Alphaproteobacteria bacterium]MBU4546166.1 PHB depolymerase family esterase [Alphaproteobacteria bacterium]MBU4553149.1 PHB depolymerase family esterase [Alphaproteobacteria bacterium]MBV1724221.1 PHB depolymerase family esterase [Hoeflea sp.]MBV1759906.1 PHB depolymerase family esterase [Hoeflea sp.]
MTRTLTASMRRMNRLMGSAQMTKATRSLQRAMTGIMVKSALAPIAALKQKAAKPRKAAAPKTGRGLGAVLKQLSTAGSLAPATRSRSEGRAAPPRIPAGAHNIERTHRSAAGSRRYKLYLPASRATQPNGLIVMLHGCKQSPDDFARGTNMNALAEKHGLAIAYPAQTGGHNAAACWNWFKPGDQRRGAGEPAILASLTRKLMKEFGLERDSVFVAGLSAGGAMAVILADVYPDVFSAAGVHSGLARGAACNVITAMSAMHKGGGSAGFARPTPAQSNPVRRIIFHGDADSTVHPSNASLIVAAAVGEDAAPAKIGNRSVRGRGYARSDFTGSDGMVLVELWMIEGAGHAWSGGRAAGSYTDSKGPNASAEMIRFFMTKAV